MTFKPANVIYLNRAGYVLARPNRKKPYYPYRAAHIPDNCPDVLPTIFDTRQQALDWMGIFNIH